MQLALQRTRRYPGQKIGFPPCLVAVLPVGTRLSFWTSYVPSAQQIDLDLVAWWHFVVKPYLTSEERVTRTRLWEIPIGPETVGGFP